MAAEEAHERGLTLAGEVNGEVSVNTTTQEAYEVELEEGEVSQSTSSSASVFRVSQCATISVPHRKGVGRLLVPIPFLSLSPRYNRHGVKMPVTS